MELLELSLSASQRRSERVSSLLQKIKAKREVKTELDDNFQPSTTTFTLGSDVTADTFRQPSEVIDNFDILLARLVNCHLSSFL